MNPIREMLGFQLNRLTALSRRSGPTSGRPIQDLERTLYGVRHMAVYGPGLLRSALDEADRAFMEFERQRGGRTTPKVVRESHALIASLRFSLDMGTACGETTARESTH